ATAQQGELGKESGIASATEIAIPVAGKVLSPVSRLLGRILKGTGSALSGASMEQIDAILKDPKAAKKMAQDIRKNGGAKVLRKEATDIMQGVSNIKKQASEAYGKGLEQ